jgi:ABC-type transport system involved in multi-copper enzyme maturation permease subunit
MTTLIRTEWLKMKKYNAFWWIIGITALSYPGINYMCYKIYENITTKPSNTMDIAKAAFGNPFVFPEVWRTTAFFSSLFVFIPAVVVIMLVSNEYTFRTHRQNVIDGWSRSQFITSKLLDVAMISLMITILFTIVALVSGFANQTRLIQDTWSQSYYIGLFFLQTFAQLSIAFLMGFLIKKAFLALGLFLFYYILLENLIVMLLWRYKFQAADYMPLEISDMIIPPPAFWGKLDPAAYQQKLDAIPLHIGLTIILTAVVWGLCYRINNRRDLK